MVLGCGSGSGMEVGCWARGYHGIVDGCICVPVVVVGARWAESLGV